MISNFEVKETINQFSLKDSYKIYTFLDFNKKYGLQKLLTQLLVMAD